jgi:nucleotide-binding universal stress UspA family protein
MSRDIESILVPTDGSAGARVGARRAIDLAASIGASLHVLSVVDTRETESNHISPDQTERGRILEEKAEQAVETVATLAQAHLSGRISTAVERGIPFRMITEYVDVQDIDLVVMGTEGGSAIERVLLGSVAETTLRTAAVPVVTVTPDADIIEVGDVTYEDILLPTDGSEEAELAIDWAITLATLLDATIHTIYSVDTRRFGGPEEMGEIHEALEETGENAIETVRERARAADLSVAGALGSGPAARTILSYSEEHDIDLIVMGTHGRTGLSRYLIGSVTETVVRKAAVPVCSVPMQ